MSPDAIGAPGEGGAGAHIAAHVDATLLALPPGCPFRPRCPRGDETCTAEPPQVSEGSRAHRCFHPLEPVALETLA